MTFDHQPLKLKPENSNRVSKIAYVVKRFPRISETFIVNEIIELERHQVDVEIFSLLEPEDNIQLGSLLKKIKAPVTYLPQHSVVKNLPLKICDRFKSTLKEKALKKIHPTPEIPSYQLFPGKDDIQTSLLMVQSAVLASLIKGFDHMHAHFATDATTVAMLTSRFSGVPFSFTAHAKDIYHTYTERIRDKAFLAEKICQSSFAVTVSDYNRAYLADLAGPGQREKIIRLYNGIDLSRFNIENRVPESGAILAVGRLIEKKGFVHLIEACALLRQRNIEFQCHIIGEGPDRTFLSDRIKTHGLEKHLTLIGAQSHDEIQTAMQHATTMVLPCVVSESGDRDGLPTVILEALASGLPTISTPVAGIPEIIEDKKSGLLVPPANAAELADAIETVLLNPDLCTDLAKGGRDKAEYQFDIEKNVHYLKELLYGCSNNPVQTRYAAV